MRLQDLISITDQLKQVQGVEKQLLQRRRKGVIGGWVALAAVIFNVLAICLSALLKILNKEAISVNDFIEFIKTPYVLIGMSVGILAVVIYFFYRWTGFLLKESEAPFRYTFQIMPFAQVEKTPDNRFTLAGGDRFHLLHHDLMERLNDRIKRLSLLDAESLNDNSKNSRTAHIYIDGHYVTRENKDGQWIIHVMPRVRIGPPSNPTTLANPVEYELTLESGEVTQATEQENYKAKRAEFKAEQYDQIIERVYSSVATEIYKQIESDVQEKMDLFPTSRLQAVALFHEAEDFAVSNTIDAYDHALELYEEALRRVTLTHIRRITDLFVSLPVFWRLRVKRAHLHARIQIGYAKCLNYRRILSVLSGRSMNPLFKVRTELERATNRLRQLHRRMRGKILQPTNRWSEWLMTWWTFPEDTLFRRLLLRPDQKLFDLQKQIFFDALVVNALTHYHLGAVKKNQGFLTEARNVDPVRSEIDGNRVDALYLLVNAIIKHDPEKKIPLLRKATEIEPNFQIAQFYLAYYSEMRFRQENEIVAERANSVIREYDEVLKSNPGNIVALAAQGYLYWLSNNLEDSEKKLREGLEVKAIIRETFVGEIQYGLGRIAAEKGLTNLEKSRFKEKKKYRKKAKVLFDDSYDLYKQAIAADPRVGAYESSAEGEANIPYYEYIGSGIIDKYKSSLKKLEIFCNTEAMSEISSKTVVKTIYSISLNDYGNACLNYYFRVGGRNWLKEAIDAFEKAITIDPSNTIAKYNVCIAYINDISQEWVQRIRTYLTEVSDKIPQWKDPVVFRSRFVRRMGKQISTARENAQLEKKEAQQKIDELEKPIKSEKSKKERVFSEKKEFQNKIEEERKNLEEIKGGVYTDEKINSLEQPKGRYTSEKIKSLEQKIGSSEQLIKPIGQQLNYLLQLRDRAEEKLKKATKSMEEEIPRLETDLKYIVRDAIERIIKHMKLTSLFDPLHLEDGQLIDQLLLSNRKIIKWERLDEGDVQALMAYAEIFLYKVEAEIQSGGTQLREVPEAIEKLFDRILKTFYPDNFGVNLRRSEILSWIDEKNEIYLTKKNDCEEVIKRTVENWLEQDPIHFHSLGWHYKYFNLDEHKRALYKARDSNSGNTQYRHNLANFYKEEGDKQWGQKAIDLYNIAAEIDPCEKECCNTRAAILDAIGSAYFEQGEYNRGIEQFKEALAFNNDNEHSVYQFHLNKATGALHFGKNALRLPAVTPIAVEVASDIAPYVESTTGDLKPELVRSLADKREVVRKTMGVQIPGISFRGNSKWHEKGAYIILINEIPMERGSVRTGDRLFPGSAEKLKELGITGRDAVNPKTGGPAFWIAEKHWPVVEKSPFDLWETTEYIVKHLQNVIRRNLSNLIAYQDVMTMLKNYCPDIYEQMIENSKRLSSLVSILRGLLSEGVPITPFEKIVEKFNQSYQDDKTLLTTIEEIRSLPEIRNRLPGNNAAYSFYQLGQNFEETVRESISGDGHESILTIKPDRYRELISAVQEKINLQFPLALITSQMTVRPLINQLLEPFREEGENRKSTQSDWPLLPILSREQLRPGLEGRIIGEIDLFRAER